MGQFVENVQATIKTSFSNLVLFTTKLLSGLILGLTVTLICQEIFNYGSILFFFVILMTTVAFMRIAKGWVWMTLLIFDLICVLVSLLLRMYILIAPGV
jgi:hypothetical protein